MKQRFLMLAIALVAGLTSTFAQTEEEITPVLDLSSVLTTSASVTVTSENDTAYPWTITDGWLTSTNKDVRSNSDFTLTVSCEHHVRFYTSFERLTSYSDSTFIVIDGVKELSQYQTYTVTGTCLRTLAPGTHTIKFRHYEGTSTSTSYQHIFRLQDIKLESYVDEMKTIDLYDAGSLGVNALEQVDKLTDMTSMKVTGTMNSDDWSNIALMTNLQYLDLEETTVTEIPASAFVKNQIAHIVWPANLQKIGDNAFYNRSYLSGDLTFPETLTSIGAYAFCNNDGLTSVVLPASMQELENGVFQSCDGMTVATFEYPVETIPSSCFYYSTRLHTVNGLENVKTVGESAFYLCYRLKNIEKLAPEVINAEAFRDCDSIKAFDFSKTTYIYGSAFYDCYSLAEVDLPVVTSLGTNAFYGCDQLKKVNIGDKITTIPNYAFRYCPVLEEVALGASVGSIGSYAFYDSNSNLKKLYINAPVPPSINTDYPPVYNRSALTLYVPKYAMVEYKLHTYWSQCGTFAENPNAVENVVLSHPLTLTPTTRIPDTPNLTVNRGAALTINGDLEQPINKFLAYYSDGTNAPIISRCANMTSNSSEVRYNGAYSSSTYWYFICPPFDVKRSDITATNDAQFVIRYYDGETRAAGESSNWKDVPMDAVLEAGQGYIFCVSKNCYLVLPATEETRNEIFSSADKSVALTEYASSDATNASWNLVGNPYPAYYDISKLEFTAPITVWSVANRTYTAYSIADDQLALLPMQGFFVQKPDGMTSIGFPADGRKLDATFETSSTAKGMTKKNVNRRLVELTLANGEVEDMTRIVVNPEASDAYEIMTDAAKMMSFETTPQFYSMRDGDSYAINEGAQTDGEVSLGMWLPKDGSYVINLKRADTEVELLDNGTAVAMPYAFDSGEGYVEGRFSVRINAQPTYINNVNVGTTSDAIYDLQGRKVNGELKRGIYIKNGKKVVK